MTKEIGISRLIKALVYWIIIRASVISIAYALVLLFVHPMVKTSATASFMPYAGQLLSGIIFLVAGVSSLASVFVKHKSYAMILCFLMITVLGYSTWHSINSAVIGTFSNGYTPDIHPHIFIATDQLLSSSVFVTYILSLIIFLSYKR